MYLINRLPSLLLGLVFILVCGGIAAAQSELGNIVYQLHVRHADDSREYYVVMSDPTGDNAILLDRAPYYPFDFSFSPDHSKLYISNIWSTIKIFDNTGILTFVFEPSQLVGPRFLGYPAWVNNNEIIFATSDIFDAFPREGNALVIFNIVTQEISLVVHGSQWNTHNQSPSVSPDQTKLIFSHEEFQTRCYLIEAELDRTRFPYPAIDYYNNLPPQNMRTIRDNDEVFPYGCPIKGEIVQWTTDVNYFGFVDFTTLSVLNKENETVKMIEDCLGFTFASINDEQFVICIHDHSGDINAYSILTDRQMTIFASPVGTSISSGRERWNPALSPNGTKIMFFCQDRPREPHLCISSLDGTDVRVVPYPDFLEEDDIVIGIQSFDW